MVWGSLHAPEATEAPVRNRTDEKVASTMDDGRPQVNSRRGRQVGIAAKTLPRVLGEIAPELLEDPGSKVLPLLDPRCSRRHGYKPPSVENRFASSAPSLHPSPFTQRMFHHPTPRPHNSRCRTVDWPGASSGVGWSRGYLALLFGRCADSFRTFSCHCGAGSSNWPIHSVLAHHEWIDCDQAQGEY